MAAAWISASLLLCLLLSDFAFSEDQINIKAVIGENKILPCRAEDRPIRFLEWKRTDIKEENVLRYRNDDVDTGDQHPSFKDRVIFQDREMKDGDVSLVLINVTMNDAGTYEAGVVYDRTDREKKLTCSIHLDVAPPPPPPPPPTPPPSGPLSYLKMALLAVLFPLALMVFQVLIICCLSWRRRRSKSGEKMDDEKKNGRNVKIKLLKATELVSLEEMALLVILVVILVVFLLYISLQSETFWDMALWFALIILLLIVLFFLLHCCLPRSKPGEKMDDEKKNGRNVKIKLLKATESVSLKEMARLVVTFISFPILVLLLLHVISLESEPNPLWEKILLVLLCVILFGLCSYISLTSRPKPVHQVKVEEGAESVLLPFNTTLHKGLGEVNVVWIGIGRGGMVHVYKTGSDQPKDQSNETRTAMNEEDLEIGDFSLTLKNPTMEDSGPYICRVIKDGDELRRKTFNLIVKAKTGSV